MYFPLGPAGLLIRFLRKLNAKGREKMPSKKLRITMYVTQEEHAHIAAGAARTCRSLSDFCRRVSMGYHVPGMEHIALRQELRGLRGDLGKLGGLDV